MAVLHLALLGQLAQLAHRAPPPPPPVPAKAVDVMLPPPAPPPQPLPTTTARDPFSIQTIGVDAPPGLPPPAPTRADGGHDDKGSVVVVVTTSSTVAPAPPATAVPQQPPPVDAETSGDGTGDEKGPGHKQPPPSGECRLMGPFAIFVQLGLGGLALMSLVYKRWRERPQRPVKIWFFDVSKQVFGSVLVHVANVFMSLLTSGRFSIKLDPSVVSAGMLLLRRDGSDQPYMPNPCSFYLLNLAIDTTVGIPILIFLVRVTTAIVAYTPLGQPAESIQSGNYGHPPNAWWWLKQSIIYFFGLFGMKVCVLIIFLTMPWISRVGDWALSWTDGNEQLQIIFAMLLFPLIMNAMQYYIIDSFIKEQTPAAAHGHQGHPGHHGRRGSSGLYNHLSDSADDEDSATDGGDSEDDVYTGSNMSLESSDDGGDEALKPAAPRNTGRGAGVAADPSYDPDVDGDSPTVIGSSSSQRSRHEPAEGTASHGTSLSKNLYPAE